LIKAVKRVSEKIIFVDYLYPEIKGLLGIFNRIIEFTAGREHYAGYKSYISNNGLFPIVKSNGLKIVSEIKDEKAGRHILLTS
ncbi:hypothetical protein ACFLTH_17035, partial [Bacteroidota bacterium]